MNLFADKMTGEWTNGVDIDSIDGSKMTTRVANSRVHLTTYDFSLIPIRSAILL